MTNTVILKRSSVANAVPTVANLTEGELALNYTDGNLFYKTAANTISVIASNKFLSVTGNVTGGNIVTSGIVTATGNITGSYFIGNGSQLTGITVAAGSSIVNGTSNVVVAASGNVTVAVAGTAAVATFTTAGIIANSVAASNNGAGTNFKVGDDTWLGDINLSDTLSVRGQQNAANAYIVFGNADSTALGRAGTGPLTYGGAFSASGNVTGNYILGNGSQLTGINTNVTVGGSNTNVQFNDNGVLGGDGKLTFNKTTGTLSATSIVFPDSAGDTVGFTAPADVTSPVTWKLPPADGTIYGNVLATDTTGNLMWRGFSSTVFVYTRTSTVAVSAINGYVNILGRTGNIYVSIT